jgi:regulator of sigma E protease
MILILQIIFGLIILGILVLVHEIGHFSAAKAFGIRVLSFSVGFGKPILKKTIGGTEYRLSAIPFGGYVNMSGEHPEEKPEVEEGDFTTKPIWQRAIVAIAGPAANFAFALLCLYLVFILGVKTPVYLLRPVVGAVADSSSAWKSGVLSGDSIMAISGHAVSTWEDVERIFSTQEQRYDVTIGRSGAVRTLPLFLAHAKSRRLPKEPTAGLSACLPAVVGSVASGTPSEKAGFKAGDTVFAINGSAIHSWFELSNAITRYDSTSPGLSFTVKRGGSLHDLMARPRYNPDAKRFQVGITVAQPATRVVRYGPVAAVRKTMNKSWEYTTMIFDVLAKLVSKQVSPKQLAGPVGIVQMSGFIALGGIVPVMDFMALIGINLAVLNLLPLIITDGGMLLFLLLEAVRRKRLSIERQMLINRIAISFFVFLFIYVTFNDILRIPDLIKVFGR